MSTFQTIIVILAIIYVVASLYFSISGRILARRKDEKDDERFKAQMNFEDQVKVLTNRLGEVMTENDRLNGVVRHWMESSTSYKTQYERAMTEKQGWQVEVEKLENEIKRLKGEAVPKKIVKKGGE